MPDYFVLAAKDTPGTAVAYTAGGTPLSHRLIPEVRAKSELPFDMTLKKVRFGKDGTQVSDDLSELKHVWVDCQPNNLAWPLWSEKMKNVVSAHLTGREGIEWMSVNVKSPDELREYYIPRFRQKLDVLDEQRTLFVSGTSHIIRPVFSRAKVADYSLFHAPEDFWEITLGLYVSKTLKEAIRKEKLIGVSFENASVV